LQPLNNYGKFIALFTRMKILLSTLFILFSTVCLSQDNDSVKWASPNVKYMPIGRGLEVGFTRIYNANIESESSLENLASENSEIETITQLEFDLKFPIIINRRSQFLGSVEYTPDIFRFDRDEVFASNFYTEIDGRHLRSRKLKLYYVRGFDSEKYINLRFSFALNGDVFDSDQNIWEFAKYTLSAVYGWQKSPRNSYGFGFYMGYVFGRYSIFPVIEWNKTWNKQWGFESNLPGKFLIRYTPNPNLRLYGGYNSDGISYRLVSRDGNSQFLQEYEVRRSDVKFLLTVEKRIYDFVWGGISTGLNYNIRLEVSDNDRLFDDKVLIENQVDPALFLKASIFIVPNEGLKKLFGYNN